MKMSEIVEEAREEIADEQRAAAVKLMKVRLRELDEAKKSVAFLEKQFEKLKDTEVEALFG